MPFENSIVNKEGQPSNLSIENSSENEMTLKRGTLAALAAFTAFSAGVENAEARAVPIPIEQVPHIFKMNQDLAKEGIEIKSLSKGLGGVRIETTRGAVTISMPSNVEASAIQNFLIGVSPKSFTNELERQNTKERDINESVSTNHGNVEISITPYAQKVLEQNNYTYKDGIIRSTINASTMNLMGTKEEPNGACTIFGSEQFKESIKALCKELKVSATGTPYASDVQYTITFTTSGFQVKQEVKR